MELHTNQHTGRRPWQCEVCGLGFKGPSNLKTHMHQHEDGMRFSCEICNRKFRDRGTCQQHVKRHLGEKKHVCEHCGKSFVITSDLKKHIRTHTGEKPFKCAQCDIQFSDGSSYARHEKMHAGKFRYQCTVCSRQYARRDACTKHIKKSHKDLGHVEILRVNTEDCRIDEKESHAKFNVLNTSIASAGSKSTNPTFRNQNNTPTAATIRKSAPLKKSWQNFETLTQEASRRFKEQNDDGASSNLDPGTKCDVVIGSTMLDSYQGTPVPQAFYGNQTLLDGQRLATIPHYGFQTLSSQVYHTSQSYKQNIPNNDASCKPSWLASS